MTHRQEWQQSAVDEEIITLNVKTLSNLNSSLEHLLYGIPGTERRNDGRLRDGWLRRYAHLEDGGWWCNGIDVLSLNQAPRPALWGCLKPEQPRSSQDNPEKVIKYEHPPKTATELFALDVPQRVWQHIAQTCNVPISSSSLWEWVINTPAVPLVITEGAKKAGAVLSAGYACIGLPGINSGYRTPPGEPSWLIDQLKVFAVKGRPIYFAFDQDSKQSTRLNNNRAVHKTALLLEAKGCTCHVITWDSPESQLKGIDDYLFAHRQDGDTQPAMQQLIDQAQPLAVWHSLQSNDLTYPADVTLNERYLPDTLQTPETARLIALKSAKGTGKTQWLAQRVQQAIQSGRRVLLLTHRVQLGTDLCGRFGIPYISDCRVVDTHSSAPGYGICTDSLHETSQARFNPEDWYGATLIIDEAEQVLWHLLNANTTGRRYRTQIIGNLARLAQNVIEGGGQIYLADADLCDVSLNHFLKLFNHALTPWIVVNHWQPAQHRTLHHYRTTSPAPLIQDLIAHIREGGIPYITTSTQQVSSNWSSQNLETLLHDEFPQASILRIDSESTADPNHPAFACIANLNHILPLYDIVICSPSTETGISIDLTDHFSSVWSIATGVQTPDSVRQAIARVRADVPRYLWCAQKMMPIARIGNGSPHWQGLLASQRKQTRLTVRALLQTPIVSVWQEQTPMQTATTPTMLNLPLALETWCRRGSIINIQGNCYRDTIINALTQEGYHLHNRETAMSSQDQQHPIEQAMNRIKAEAHQAQCVAISQADDLSDNELARLQDQRQKTEQERHTQRKGEIFRKYGRALPVTPQLVKQDDDGWYKRIKLHYYLTVGRDYVSHHDRSRLLSQTHRKTAKTRTAARQSTDSDTTQETDSDSPTYTFFEPDFNQTQMTAQVLALEKLNLMQFCEEGKIFTEDTITDWYEEILSYAQDIKTFLNVSIHRKLSPIQAAQNLLKKIGLKLNRLGRPGGRAHRTSQRRYAAALITDERETVFAAWLERDQKLYDPQSNNRGVRSRLINDSPPNPAAGNSAPQTVTTPA